MALTKVQLRRLREIERASKSRWGFDPRHAGVARTTTLKLRLMGLITIEGEQVAKTGRMVALGYARLTDAGRAALSQAEHNERLIADRASLAQAGG